jgi:outer membrane protein OmpA-like peptidoglycan-associated protein
MTLLLATGCQNGANDEIALLTEENEDLRLQLEDRNDALDAANEERRQQAMTIMDQRQRISDLETMAAAQPAQPTMPNIEGVEWSAGAGQVTATIASDLLFDSGKATLKSAAKKSLDQVASLLNGEYSGRAIRVEGHTDTDPIRKSGFKSNHHLGFERAMSVRTYLVSKGVSGERIVAASHGPDVPRGSKAQSRRVEIIVVMD